MCNQYQVKMRNIANLYADMKKNNKFREQFTFTYNGVRFEVIFLADRSPFELLIGAVGLNFAATLQMHRGFMLDCFPNEQYYALRRILRLRPTGDKFTSIVFLKYLDNQSPQCCTRSEVRPHQIARYKCSELSKVPDAEQIYFVGWVDQTNARRTARNIEKTRIMFGDAIADFCARNNISSVWSANPPKNNPDLIPPRFPN